MIKAYLKCLKVGETIESPKRTFKVEIYKVLHRIKVGGNNNQNELS